MLYTKEREGFRMNKPLKEKTLMELNADELHILLYWPKTFRKMLETEEVKSK